MGSSAILFTNQQATPRVVSLSSDGKGIYLHSVTEGVESVPWWRLYRTEDQGTIHKFRRLDRKDWELSVISGSDRALLAHIGRRPLHRLIHPFRRLESLKVMAGVAVLAFTLAQHAPPQWAAPLIPRAAQAHLVDGIIAQGATRRCSYPGGEAAVRKLLTKLDPLTARSVDVVAFNDSGYTVTSTPGRKIILLHGALAELDANALAALLAHELSHIRHGDPIVAAVRHNGLLGVWGAILEGSGRQRLRMDFSGLEERRADLEAMQMMRTAGIPLKAAANMFEQMRVAKAQGGYFAYDQRDFHFGIDARAQRWAAAAAADPPNLPPVLTQQEEDALFNFCWVGKLKPLAQPEERSAPSPQEPGVGSIPGAPPVLPIVKQP